MHFTESFLAFGKLPLFFYNRPAAEVRQNMTMTKLVMMIIIIMGTGDDY